MPIKIIEACIILLATKNNEFWEVDGNINATLDVIQIKFYSTLSKIQMVSDGSKYLPNWNLAQTHGKASKVGFYDETSPDSCPCCHQKTHKEEIPLCENTKSLEFLGFGFPLFYMFIRNCLLLLLLLIVSNNLISLFISVQDGTNYCNTHPAGHEVAAHSPHHFFAQRTFAHLNEEASEEGKVGEGHGHAEDPDLYLSRKCGNLFLMIARTDKNQKDYEIVLRIGSFLIHVMALLYIKDKIIKTWEYYDQMESDLSDYAVIVKNIPEGTTNVKGKLQKFIETEMVDDEGKHFVISDTILIPDSEKVHHINHEEEEALEKFLHAKSIGEQHLEHHIGELDKLHSEKYGIVQDTIRKIRKDTIEATNAILIFETEPQKECFLDQVGNQQVSHKIQKYFDNASEPLIIEEAPEPREIIYENLQYAHARPKNVLIGWGLSLLFLLVTTVVFYFLQLIKTNNLVAAIEEKEQNPDSSQATTRKVIATIIAWATLLGIVFFNKFIMGNVLHYFTHLEKHDNKAHEDFSFAFKYALGMFFTTALMTIMVEALKFHNYYKHDFGVIEEETIMFILCAFLVPLIWLIHPLQQCHVHARNKHYGHYDVSQHEANHLMADYHYDMGKRYAQLIEMMWFTFLYADLIPIGAFLILVGFIIYYWVDKYNLLRRSSLEGNISGDLAMKCLFLLDLTLFWRFLGELIFDIQIRDGAKSLTLIFLGLSILYMLVPWETVLKLVNDEKFKLNEKTYSNEMKRFDDDNYRIYHPIYKEIISHGDRKGGQAQIVINQVLLHGRELAENNKGQGPVNSSLKPQPVLKTQPFQPAQSFIPAQSSFQPSQSFLPAQSSFQPSQSIQPQPVQPLPASFKPFNPPTVIPSYGSSKNIKFNSGRA